MSENQEVSPHLDEPSNICIISSNENKVYIEGPFRTSDLPKVVIHIQNLIGKGNKTIALDFSDCATTYSTPMLGLCSNVLKLRESGLAFDLILPSKIGLAKIFINANWAHIISPTRYIFSTFKGIGHISATQFQTLDEQSKIVNNIINAILGNVVNIKREDLAALEWSISEITDNVLTHSNSSFGGLIQFTTFSKYPKRVQFTVADSGIGIPNSLAAGHPEISSDAEALQWAIREGVTRDKKIGQGNGLFGSYEICSRSNGYFHIESGNGKLVFNGSHGLYASETEIPYNGTLISVTIDFSIPGLLEEALKFKGEVYRPVDYIELNYENESNNTIVINLKDESESFGTRPAGTPIRNRLLNLINMNPQSRILINFHGIPFISSSFADEVFGKLFVEIGPVAFTNILTIYNISSTATALINKAIVQRCCSQEQEEVDDNS